MFNPKKRFTEDCGGFTVNNEQGPVGPGAAALAGKTNDFLILNGSAPGGVGLPAALQSYILQQQQQQSQQQSQEILFSSVQQLLSGLGAGGDSANNYNSLTALTHQQHTPQPSPVPSGQVSGAESSNTAGTKWSSSSSITSPSIMVQAQLSTSRSAAAAPVGMMSSEQSMKQDIQAQQNMLPQLVQNLLQANTTNAPPSQHASNGWVTAVDTGGQTSTPQDQLTQQSLLALLTAHSNQQHQQQQVTLSPPQIQLPVHFLGPQAELQSQPLSMHASTADAIQQLVQSLSSGNPSSSIAAIAAVLAAAALSPQALQTATPQPYACVHQEDQETPPASSGVGKAHSVAAHPHSSSGDTKVLVSQDSHQKKKIKPPKQSFAKASQSMAEKPVAVTLATGPQGPQQEKKKKLNLFVLAKAEEETDWGKPGVDYTCYPCPARSVAATDHYRIGVLRVPKNVQHAQELLCTHSACRSKGVRFLYCTFCEQPVAKANFGTRHRHLEEKQRQAKEAALSNKKMEQSSKKRKNKEKHSTKMKRIKKSKDDREEPKTPKSMQVLLRSSAFSALLGAATAVASQEEKDDGQFSPETSHPSKFQSQTLVDEFGDNVVFPKRKHLRLSSHTENTEGSKSSSTNKRNDEAVSFSAEADSKDKDDRSLSEITQGHPQSGFGDVPDTILFRKKGRKRRPEPTNDETNEPVVTSSENTTASNSGSSSQPRSSDSGKKQDETTNDIPCHQQPDDRNTSEGSSQHNTADSSDIKGRPARPQKSSLVKPDISDVDQSLLGKWRSILDSRPVDSTDHDATEQWIQEVIRVSTKAMAD